MNARTPTTYALVLACASAAMALRAQAAPLPITYQGQLKHQDIPVNGEGRFAFTLWDAEEGGGQVGSVVETATEIVNGLFTAQLDFGPNAFQGAPRWLEIQVATSQGEGRLSPRQPITPAPFALYALDAPGGGGTLTLPFAGTNTTDQTAIAVTNNGLAPAAAFATDNASNTQAAVLATTTGSGAGLFAMTGGSGPAVWGLTGDGGGMAGLFRVQGISAAQAALGAENSAMGSAGHFKTTKRENTNPALLVETFSDGSAATFTTHADINNVNLAPTVAAENNSFGIAGEFVIKNNQSTNDVLRAGTNGGGNAIHAYTNGSGRAGFFEVDNIGARTIPALDVVSNGRGGGAGLFKTTNALNTAAALTGESSGGADAIRGVAKGSGAAVTGYNAFGGNAVVGLVEGDTGKAGSFKITDTTNGEPAVEAVTEGTGPAGFFESKQLSGQPIALRAKANATSGWAGYFEGRGYFSQSVGVGTTAPEANLHVVGPGISTPILQVGDTFIVGARVAIVDGELRTDRVEYTTPKTHYHSIGPTDFVAQPVSDVTYFSPGWESTSGQFIDAYASVHLPDGARLMEVTLYYHDTNPDEDLWFVFKSVHLPTGVHTGFAELYSSGSSGFGSDTATVGGSSGVTINNNGQAYYIKARAMDSSCGTLDPCDWADGVDIMGVVLRYEVDETH